MKIEEYKAIRNEGRGKLMTDESIKKVKRARLDKGFSQGDIGDMFGFTRQYYQQIEVGTKRPSIELAKTLAEILEIEWTTFYE